MLEQPNLSIGDNQPLNTSGEVSIAIVQNRIDVCLCAFQLFLSLAITLLGIIVLIGRSFNCGDMR